MYIWLKKMILFWEKFGKLGLMILKNFVISGVFEIKIFAILGVLKIIYIEKIVGISSRFWYKRNIWEILFWDIDIY